MLKRVWSVHSRAGMCSRSVRNALDYALRQQEVNKALYWASNLVSAGLGKQLIVHLIWFALTDVAITIPDVLKLCLDVWSQLHVAASTGPKNKRLLWNQLAEVKHALWQEKIARLVKQLATLDKSRVVISTATICCRLLPWHTLVKEESDTDNTDTMVHGLLKQWKTQVEHVAAHVLTDCKLLDSVASLSTINLAHALRESTSDSCRELQQLLNDRDHELCWIANGLVMEQAATTLLKIETDAATRMTSGRVVEHAATTVLKATLSVDLAVQIWLTLRLAVGQLSSQSQSSDWKDAKTILCRRLALFEKLYFLSCKKHHGFFSPISRLSWLTALWCVGRFSPQQTLVELPDYNVTVSTDELKESGWTAVMNLHNLQHGLLTSERIIDARRETLPIVAVDYWSEMADLPTSQHTSVALQKWCQELKQRQLCEAPIDIDEWGKTEIGKSHRPGIYGQPKSSLLYYWRHVIPYSRLDVDLDSDSVACSLYLVSPQMDAFYHTWAAECVSCTPASEDVWLKQCWFSSLQPALIQQWPLDAHRFIVLPKPTSVKSKPVRTATSGKRKRPSSSASATVITSATEGQTSFSSQMRKTVQRQKSGLSCDVYYKTLRSMKEKSTLARHLPTTYVPLSSHTIDYLVRASINRR